MPMQFCHNRFIVDQGDITAFIADGIVNAANNSLLSGGGVDGMIHKVGGPDILAECRFLRQTSYSKGLPTGDAVATTAGQLSARYVIHTVGPVWQGGEQGEEDLLIAAYQNSLRRATELKVGHLAFPAISTGVFGYPFKLAAQVAARTIAGFLAASLMPEKVSMVLYSDQDYSAFVESVQLVPGL